MRFLRSTFIIGSLTGLSRVLGLVRDQLMAAFLGAGLANDAFVVALRFPNLFRRWFAEGAFSAAFIPLYGRRLDDKEQADRFASEALSALLTVTGFVVIVCQLAMPFLMYALAPGYASDPEKFNLTILYTQITMPYLVFMALASLFGGVLNTRGFFAAAAAAPVILNLVLIAAFVGARHQTAVSLGFVLSFGVSFAGALQTGLVYWGCRRAGVRLSLALPRLTKGVKALIALSAPGLVAAGVTQINLLVSGVIASFRHGVQSWLYYADRLYQLPLGMIGVALSVALLPALTRSFRKKDQEAARHHINRALEMGMFLTLPAMAALLVSSEFFIRGLFEHGAFGPTSTEQTSYAAQAFAMGLPAFVGIKIFTPAFFAREDTKTPMRYAVVSVLVNIILALFLFQPFGAAGLALATSLAGWVHLALLVRRLCVLKTWSPDIRLIRRLPLMMVSSVLMGVCVGFAASQGAHWFGRSIMSDFLVLLIVFILGLVSYALFSLILRSVRFADLQQVIRRG